MASLNRVNLIGNLGKDPEIRHTQSGAAVANLSLATNEVFKNASGEKVERTEWHRVVLFGKLAEVAGEYLKKGSPIYLEGRLQTRSWEKDGATRYATEVVGTSLQFLGNGNGNGKKNGGSDEPPPVGDNDIPF
jgi:single-strand DNA-binding protein